jgi:hypothetical protein
VYLVIRRREQAADGFIFEAENSFLHFSAPMPATLKAPFFSFVKATGLADMHRANPTLGHYGFRFSGDERLLVHAPPQFWTTHPCKNSLLWP